MNDFTRMRVYRAAVELVDETYAFTRSLPPDEKYELARQMKRSVTSVPFNIAEGAGRGDQRDFARFVRIAIGSLNELQSQLDVCDVLGFGTQPEIPTVLRSVISVRKQAYVLEATLSSGR